MRLLNKQKEVDSASYVVEYYKKISDSKSCYVFIKIGYEKCIKNANNNILNEINQVKVR